MSLISLFSSGAHTQTCLGLCFISNAAAFYRGTLLDSGLLDSQLPRLAVSSGIGHMQSDGSCRPAAYFILLARARWVRTVGFADCILEADQKEIKCIFWPH